MHSRIMKRLFIILISVCSFALQAQDEKGGKGSLQLEVDTNVARLQQYYVEMNAEDPGTSGYRVQIYNGDRKTCLRMRSKFIDAFPGVPVYTVYDQPEFKVQAGDFRTRLEADRFKREVQKRFSGSIVVKTRIKFPELRKPGDKTKYLLKESPEE